MKTKRQWRGATREMSELGNREGEAWMNGVERMGGEK